MSLTPCFSKVWERRPDASTVSTVSPARAKLLKQFQPSCFTASAAWETGDTADWKSALQGVQAEFDAALPGAELEFRAPFARQSALMQTVNFMATR
jgi:hypothetical protein